MRNRRSSGVYHDLRIVIHSRITRRKGADPRAAGYLGRRKSGAYEIRFTDVFYASTIFPAAEIRGTISRLAPGTGGTFGALPLQRIREYSYAEPWKDPRRCDRRVRPAVK